MKRLSALVLMATIVSAAAIACTDISGSSTAVLSIQFDTLPAPAVVIGDTLRDTTGAIVLPVVRAFNFKGGQVTPVRVFFQSPDSGITVDSASGMIVGDSLRSTPARVVATVGNLQAIQHVDITLRPDSIQAVNAADTINYAILDSTKNVAQVQVKVSHGTAPNDSAVKSYIVSFQIVYQPTPGLGELLNQNGRPSVVDTTDASGIAARTIRLHPVFLSSATAVDSIVVNATTRYRGNPVGGSPVRIVVLLKPVS
ncbi:MAG TPA: hypothetical protein VGG76_13075 [Gemmatimonadaceae bacterium]|jgi:hypothetical protein